jgi:peroxiredoxin
MSRTKPKKKAKPEQPRRSSRTPTLIFAGIIIIIVLVGWYAFSAPVRTPGGVGIIAPDFQLPEVTDQGLTNNMIQLSSFRGKVVVLEFMISWCHVCQQMASAVAYMSDKYSGQGVVFLSVAGTQQGASASSTAQFIRDHGATWTHVLDTDVTVFPAYGVEATPIYFILDGSGKILSRFQGIISTDAFTTAIDAALSS